MSQEGTSEIQQGREQGPTCGMEQPCGRTQSEECLAVSSCAGKELDPGSQQAKHKPTVCSSSQDGPSTLSCADRNRPVDPRKGLSSLYLALIKPEERALTQLGEARPLGRLGSNSSALTGSLSRRQEQAPHSSVWCKDER